MKWLWKKGAIRILVGVESLTPSEIAVAITLLAGACSTSSGLTTKRFIRSRSSNVKSFGLYITSSTVARWNIGGEPAI